jgi:type III secretion protein V
MASKTSGLSLMRYSDLVLAALVVGVVGMMIIPLPTFLLDILITTNISMSVVLLLVSIYINNALKIAAFPSILLITTLFRLGLNVSSTRLILLQADAGTVIQSFGDFVVAGNLVVGAVVFLILTLIQFIVIAKGSERVAEVAARFTLDAMPGKQMSIDADVRAGTIDMDAARRMRSSLQRESQLYGSMDGAMKFVKGDAVAGILITLINIIGGLLIGVMQRGMSAGEAATLFTRLTIGDGLVSQIPALLIATSAGIVVTRVASEEEGTHLGRDIGTQILAQPKAIALAAGLLVALAIIPGLPTVPFLVLAVVLGAVAYSRRPSRTRKRSRGRRGTVAARGLSPLSSGASQTDDDEAEEDQAFAPPAAVGLEVGTALTVYVDTEQEGGQLVSELVPGLRELLYGELGVILPGVHVRGDAPGLPPDEYRILMAEVPVASGRIDGERHIVWTAAEDVSALGIGDVREENPPGVAPPACSIPAASASTLLEAGQSIVEPSTLMVLHLGQVLRLHADELIGIQETQHLLDSLERTHPALVSEVIPRVVSVQLLSDILSRLLNEGIGIRNMREILETLAEPGPPEKDPLLLAERVRQGLRRYITHRYTDPQGNLRAFVLDPAIEEVIRESIQKTASGNFLALEPELAQEIVAAVRTQAELIPSDEPMPVVLTNPDIRRYLRRLLEADFPSLSVLCFNELMPTVNVQLVARLSL